MYEQSTKTEDIILRDANNKTRLTYWSGKLAELKGKLDSAHMTVSEYSATCSDINNARIRVINLKRELTK